MTHKGSKNKLKDDLIGTEQSPHNPITGRIAIFGELGISRLKAEFGPVKNQIGLLHVQIFL
jgi:hypothetical protein